MKVRKETDSNEKEATTQGNGVMSPDCISPRFVFIESMDEEE